MRIVVVTTSFPRTADDPSGHFVRSSALELARQGHEVHVVAPGGSPRDLPRFDGELVVHRAGGGALFGWPGAVARAREAPLRALAAGPYAAGVMLRLAEIGAVDRAVAHWIVPSAYPLALAIRAPLEVFAHGADVRALAGAPRFVREHVLGALLRRGARFTFAARALLETARRGLGAELAGELTRHAHVEPPPIDVPAVGAEAERLRAALRLRDGERLVVVACRLVPTKRVELALDALVASRPSRGAATRLVVVGDGPARLALERHAAALEARAGAVTFTGALPRRQALAWIAAADVLVHPSAVEAAPTVIREARALHVPVVATDAGDVGAWAHDDPGIALVEPTAEAIASAVARAPFRASAPAGLR